MLPLVLASASPRRRELLTRVGIPLDVRSAEVEETGELHVEAELVSLFNARLKAEAVARQLPPGQLVLAADTEVVLEGQALGKPASPEEARRMLERLSGRTHQVITAFVLMRTGSAAPESRIEQRVSTDVTFKVLRPREITGYLSTGEPFDKAGGYGIQGMGAFLVRRIEGSYTNVVGLPLTEVLEALELLGGPTGFLEHAAEEYDAPPTISTVTGA